MDAASVWLVEPPVVERHWNVAPMEGVTSAMTSALPAARELRNMTPALAAALVLVWLTTRAVMEPFPLRVV